MGVPPNHPVFHGFSTINHPFGGTPISGNLHFSHLMFHPASEGRKHHPGSVDAPATGASRSAFWVESEASGL